MYWTGGYIHGAPQDSVTARFFPPLWTSVTARSPTLWTGGYIRGASQVSVKARYPTTHDSVTARNPTTHNSVTVRIPTTPERITERIHTTQVSVTARCYPTLWTGGYIRGASHVSVTERSYPHRTGGFTHGVLHVCKLACT